MSAGIARSSRLLLLLLLLSPFHQLEQFLFFIAFGPVIALLVPQRSRIRARSARCARSRAPPHSLVSEVFHNSQERKTKAGCFRNPLNSQGQLLYSQVFTHSKPETARESLACTNFSHAFYRAPQAICGKVSGIAEFWCSYWFVIIDAVNMFTFALSDFPRIGVRREKTRMDIGCKKKRTRRQFGCVVDARC
ncbi:MAG TPA: hypothetical protein VFA71_03885 [Terriglobales bacterium]|nr:hypothetical protein [Terriglobales bacterium]